MNTLGRMSTPRREKSHRGHFILDQLEKRMSEQEESVMLKRDFPKDKPRPGGHGRAVVVLVAFVAGAAVGSVLQSVRRKRRSVANSKLCAATALGLSPPVQHHHLAACRRIPVPVVDDTKQLQQPSRQRRPHCGALDLPQYPPAQTEFDTQSARLACQEAGVIFERKRYKAAADVIFVLICFLQHCLQHDQLFHSTILPKWLI